MRAAVTVPQRPLIARRWFDWPSRERGSDQGQLEHSRRAPAAGGQLKPSAVRLHDTSDHLEPMTVTRAALSRGRGWPAAVAHGDA